MKNFCVKITNHPELNIQVLKNICLYCLGDFYLNHKYIECRFEEEDQKKEFEENLKDLGIEPI